ncbi:MAG TPA: outer membrane beta-barrel protein [Candidatus Acidoferrales bacterium]|nr:outer membrane beta-barrel protein [Candidatus Acidoferrales bacterium]
MTKMRSALILMLLLSPARCWAQSANRVEIYGGYSFVNNDFTGGTLYNNQTSLNRGWNASVNLKLNRLSQFVADFGGSYLPLSSDHCGFGVNSCSSSAYTLMFGPQISFQSKLTPFAHVLIGVALAHQSSGTIRSLVSNHSFVEAFGGGVDYGITRHFGLRAQVDFLQTHFTNGDNQVPFDNGHFRISGGLVIRF